MSWHCSLLSGERRRKCLTSNGGLPLLGENPYFDFTSMVPEEAGCSVVAGWPDMG